jgi:hypothetical protein
VRTEKKPQISLLSYPGFPVEFGGVDDLNAAFLNESRTRGHVQRRAAGNPGVISALLDTWVELNDLPFGFANE